MGQSFYYLVVVVLGVANVGLAAVAYSQRSRQLAGRGLVHAQIALAEERNRMAEERIERLDRQVALLSAIRDSLEPRAERPRPRPDVAGVIDVGSTTVRLIVVERTRSGERRTIGDERAFLHLGAEVAREGSYTDETLRSAAARVAAYRHHAASIGCERLRIVVTAPGRIGANPGQLVHAVEQACGHPVIALSPQDEAALTFAGAAGGVCGGERRLAVCDVGGGSTDIALGSRSAGVDQTLCFELGALTLAERFFGDGHGRTPRELVAAAELAREVVVLPGPPECDLVLMTGGSATATAKLVGSVVDAEALGDALKLSAELPKRARRRMHSRRRWSLPAGILLLQAVQAQFGIPLTISRDGLREGVIEQMLEGADAPLHGGPSLDLAAVRAS